MRRNTKIKIAAFVTAFVATLGMAGVSTATATSAHGTVHTSLRDTGSWCC